MEETSKMKRREFLKNMGKTTFGLVASSSLLGLINGCSSPKKDKKWNIVFILSDDQGWNQVGYHRFEFYETPNIDRIAREGMQFTDAYSAAPVCSPTRASIMTGKHPARLHLTDYIPGNPFPYQKLITPQQTQGLPLNEITLPELLKQNGYITGHFGKWHLNKDKNYETGRPGDPGSQGFDEIYTSVKPAPDANPDEDAHHTIEITNKSVEFIEKHKDEPFFCYVPYHCVHRPIMENEALIKKYEAKPGADEADKNPIMGAMIERMDDGIGKILKKLDELSLTEKTIVIFISDNGGLEQLQSQHPLRKGKATIFDGGLRVPFTIRWPGVIEQGSKSTVPVISHDLFPTIMEALAIKYSIKNIDGKSLMPLLKQTGKIKRDAIFFHYPHYHHQGFKPASAIRSGDYKLIEWYEQALLGEENQVNLFNIKEDMGETKDLAKEKPELAKQLREKLIKWRKDVGAQEMKVNPNYDPARADMRTQE